MRFVVTGAVLLAVVSTAVVAVCQHSESRRLQHRLWQLEKRRLRLERQAQRLESAVQAGRTPRRLLVETDLELLDGLTNPVDAAEAIPAPRRERAPEEIALPPGFVTGGNFEGGDR